VTRKLGAANVAAARLAPGLVMSVAFIGLLLTG
jgi:hypothetical protein